MTLTTLIQLWPIIVSLLTVVGAGGAARYALAVLEKRLDHLDATAVKTHDQVASIALTSAVQAAQLAAHTEQDRQRFEQLHQELERIAS
jgi:hypothetical protein